MSLQNGEGSARIKLLPQVNWAPVDFGREKEREMLESSYIDLFVVGLCRNSDVLNIV